MKFLTYSYVVLALFLLAACAQAETNNDMAHDESDHVHDDANDMDADEMKDTDNHDMMDDGMNHDEMMDDMMGPVKEFTVEMSQFAFSPDPITVQEGDHVKLTFVAVDVAHGVSMPEFGVKTRKLEIGESETVEFVADKKGSYTYFCNVFCGSGHRDMKGTFIVE